MEQSFTILAKEYRPMVVAYLRAMVSDAHLAEDLTQETFLAANESLAGFDPDGDFGRWLRGIARNKALMHWRAQRSQPLLIDSRVLDGIEEVFDHYGREREEGNWWDGRRSAMLHCVSLLSDHLKAAIERVYDRGDSLDEAALALGTNPATVGQRLSRARKQIRECVGLKLKTQEDYV